MNCGTCKYYTAPDGSEGRWMVCSQLKVADVFNDYKTLPKDGVGYSDASYSSELAELYVGENFGCIKYERNL
jgi:hypothetical protein